MTKSALLIEHARPGERTEAFRLAFQHLQVSEQVSRIANALELAAKNEIDPTGILVARTGGRLVGSLIAMTTQGAGGLIWPPQVSPDTSEKSAIEDELIRIAFLWLRQRGAKIAQTMLAPSELSLGEPLRRNGMPHITALAYLRRSLNDPIPPATGRVEFEPFLTNPTLFGQILLRTYEQTQDCPELTGARKIDEILEGHRAQGKYDPARWWLARQDGEPVGVLLLTLLPEWASWDVCYVGVVPNARGQGVGRTIMLKAVQEAQAAAAGSLTLSVDVRNAAAWRLYHNLGFEEFDRREVFLKVWGNS
jgi:mycothiol synthase